MVGGEGCDADGSGGAGSDDDGSDDDVATALGRGKVHIILTIPYHIPHHTIPYDANPHHTTPYHAM